MNQRKILGVKFEIWVEELLKDLGHNLVARNVLYISKKGKRQVDIEYFDFLNPFKTYTIVECKYLSNRSLGVSSLDDNVVKILKARRKFVKAGQAELYTNQYFTRALREQARKYKIKLYDKDDLERFDRKRKSIDGFGIIIPPWKKKSLEEQIKDINIRDYELKATVKRI